MKTSILKFIIIMFALTANGTFSQWQPNVRLSDYPFSSRTGLHNARNVATDGNMVHVVWDDYRFGASGEVYYKRSTDKGVTWGDDTRLTDNIGSSMQANVAAANQVVHVVWRDSYEDNPDVYYKRSTDGGISWGPEIKISSGAGSTRYPMVAVSGQVVHVVFDDDRHTGSEVYYRRSSDQGVTWGPETRLTNVTGASYFCSIAVVDQNVHITWEDSRDGPYREIYYKRSTDGGLNWGADTRLTNDPSKSYFSSVAASGQYVHLTWNDERDGNMEIYYKRSTDGGTTWGADTRMTNNSFVSEIACITVLGQVVHLVWQDIPAQIEIMYRRSTDGGISFEPEIQLSTPSFLSWHPAVAVGDSVVHVVWEDFRDGSTAEVYYKRNPNGNPNGITQISSNVPEGFSLSQNYPNPFNPKTNIGLRIADFGFVSLKVFDVTGKEVAVLVNENLRAGEYNVDFDASNLASGMYFYRMETAGFTEVKKMILIK